MGVIDSTADRRVNPDVPEEDLQEVNSALREAFPEFLQHQGWARLDSRPLSVLRQFRQHCVEQGKGAGLDSLKNQCSGRDDG